MSASPGRAGRSFWRRLTAAVLAWSALASCPAQSRAPSVPADLADRAELAFRWGDFDELERLLALAEQPGARVEGGYSALNVFRNGVGRVLAVRKYLSAYFVEMEGFTLARAKAQPDSPLAHALHVQTLLAHAWWHRGNGFNNTVSPEARREFERRVDAAVAYAAAQSRVMLKDPFAYRLLLDLGRAAGWPLERQWLLAQEGLKQLPDDDDLYFALLQSALPKWGGSPAAVDRVVTEAVARTRSTRGLEMYARLYAEAADAQFQSELFTASRADWAQMKQGYQDLVSRHDTPVRHNQFAWFACMARDKATLLDELEKVGPAPDLESWGSNARSNFQGCRRWASEQ